MASPSYGFDHHLDEITVPGYEPEVFKRRAMEQLREEYGIEAEAGDENSGTCTR
jgi:hypothetical protein